MNYFDYASKTIDNENREYKGVALRIPNFSLYKEYFEEYVVDEKTCYRPDKIAHEIYDDYTLSWVLDEINAIKHMKEYTYNKVIYYLPYAILNSLGVI